jgi:hypothetical protein
MQSLDDRPFEDWDLGDRLTFALAGLARVASEGVKDSLNPCRGFVDNYPTVLLAQIDFWRDDIVKIQAEIESQKTPLTPAP